MTWLILALNILAVVTTLGGALVCGWYASRCRSDERVFYYLASLIQLYTALIYSLALAGDWYIVKAGILGRLSQIMYAGLLTAWAIAHSRRCK